MGILSIVWGRVPLGSFACLVCNGSFNLSGIWTTGLFLRTLRYCVRAHIPYASRSQRWSSQHPLVQSRPRFLAFHISLVSSTTTSGLQLPARRP